MKKVVCVCLGMLVSGMIVTVDMPSAKASSIIAPAIDQYFLTLQLRGVADTVSGLESEVHIFDGTADVTAYGEITITRVSDNTVLFSHTYNDPNIGDFANPGTLDDPLPVLLPYNEPLDVHIVGREYSNFRAYVGDQLIGSGGYAASLPNPVDPVDASIQITLMPVPEPTTLALVAIGMFALCCRRRRTCA